jgi:periplasmic protein TonB
MMAYTDTNRGLKPASLAITVLVNGSVIAGLLMLGTNVIRTTNDAIKTITTTPIAPPIKQDSLPHKQKAKENPKPQNPYTPPIKNQTSVDRSPPIELTSSLAGDEFLMSGTGEGLSINPPELPPIIAPPAPPVFTIAKRNPRYAGDFQPDYPPGMIREGREGAVTVRVLVGVDGRVKQVEAVRADDDAFLQVTKKQALSRWRFVPATKDGVPQESWQELTVRFQIPV